jgi:16S rRNA (cytosine967-C5)-methyltransferase
VRPGGRLIYVTCSLLPAENGAQIDRFLEQRPDFALRPVPAVWAETIGGACPVEGPCLALTPARHGTDGFFLALLERREAVP